MGLALPGAVAAARMSQQSAVLAICGDGDAMTNVQEMETAIRLGLSLTVMVWVDGGFGLIERKQQSSAGETSDLQFQPIKRASLADTFG